MPCHKWWNSDSGTARSSTSSVVAIANTPSLNASVRPVSHLLLTASLLVRRRPARSYASIDRRLCRLPTHGQPGRGPSISDQAPGKDRPHRGTRSLLDRSKRESELGPPALTAPRRRIRPRGALRTRQGARRACDLTPIFPAPLSH